MRSSIACARCRRSKVKCLNNGVNTPCRACIVAGRECVYPSPASGDRSHRRDGSLGRSGDPLSTPDAPRSVRSKPKKSTSQYFGLQSNRALVDALDPTVLTPQVWLDLFEIWQLHYAIDLPFIHPPSFLKILRQAQGASASQDFATPKTEGTNELPAVAPEFLLGFLALTSRFHSGLIAHHSPGSSSRPSNPLIAAEYYASACKSKLSLLADGSVLGSDASRQDPDIFRVQAYLMLAFHEWGDSQGIKAWDLLGTAIRYSHLIGLNSEDTDNAYSKTSIVQPLHPDAVSLAGANTEDALRLQETRRRTFWSCFVLERCLSSGRFMPLTIRSEDIQIQLPASDRAFLFNEKVRTPLLSDSADAARAPNGEHRPASSGNASMPSPGRPREPIDPDVTWETGPYEGLVSRYVKASEAFNAVIQWSSRGGRLNEKYPPWDHQSTWNSLYRSVNKLIEKLPRDLTLSQANISAHITSRTSSSFTLLHTMLLLSKIILHREFLPFLPMRGTHPKGPVDNLSPFASNTLPDSTFSFWGESADEMFKSARELLNLYLSCVEWKVLVETPLVGFASYMIAAVGLYSVHFPWMDTKEHLSTNPNSSQGQAGFLGLFAARDVDIARKACDLVALFKPKVKMADGWFKTLGRLHRYYLRTKRELRRNYKFDPFAFSGPYQGRSSILALRMTEEPYKPLEATFGRDPSPSADDTEMMDAPDSAKEELVGSHVQSTEGAAREAWAAVNAVNNLTTSTQSTNAAPQTSNGSSYPLSSTTQTSYPAISPSSAPHPYTPSAAYSAPSNSTTTTPKSPGLTSAQPSIEPSTESIPTRQPPSQNWTHEQLESWLNTLETVFGGNDVAAFIEAADWRTFGSASSPTKGWLKLIWHA